MDFLSGIGDAMKGVEGMLGGGGGGGDFLSELMSVFGGGGGGGSGGGSPLGEIGQIAGDVMPLLGML